VTKQPKRRASADRSPEGARSALLALYAELPTMQCQGLCADSCYSLVQTSVERDLVADVTGVRLALVQTPLTACPALGMLKTCTVYEVRPLICRLWGMTPGMRCQYGCVPEGGFLSAEQTYGFLARAAELAGDTATAEQMRAVFRDDPVLAERMMMRLQRERDLKYEDKVRRAGTTALFVTGPGQISKNRPRGGRW
jgi:Fe-S-cluster containining protein